MTGRLFQADGWRGTLSVYGARLAGIALGLILAVVSARLLGPAGRGEYAAALAGVVLGVQLLNLGLSSSLLLLFSEDPGRVRRGIAGLWALAAAWLLLLGLGGIALSVTPLAGSLPFLRWWPFWVVWIPLQLLELYQVTALTALKSYKAIAILEIGGRLAAVGLGLGALLSFGGRVAPFLAALILSDFLTALAGAFLILREPRRAEPDSLSAIELGRTALRVGLRAYPVLFLPYLVIRSDLLILRAFRGAAETGIYSIAAQLVDLGLLLPATVGAFLLPDIVRGVTSVTAVAEQARRVVLYAAGLSLAAAVLGAPLIRLVFGEPYRDSYGALLLLLPGFVALSLQIVIVQHFNAKGYPLFVAAYWLAAAATNIGLNLALVPRFGMHAAAMTSSLAYILVCLLALLRFRRDTALSWRSLVFGAPLGNAA